MIKEIWLWVLEKLKAFLGTLAAGCNRIWRYFTGWVSTVSGSTWRKLLAAIPLLLLFYILIGMMVVNRIDDQIDPPLQVPAGGSRTVAAITFLVERETLHHNWTPNDPVFLPGWWLDNTPAFQKGMIGAISRFGFELRDQIGRTRGSSAVDEGLERAAGNLSKEPNRWVFNLSTSLLPTTASDVYYQEAARDLAAYNSRLSTGDAVFEKRADNLQATLDRIALDLGASSAALEDYIGTHAGGFLPDTGADDLFYQTKGQVYAYTVIIAALRQDFAQVIDDKQLGSLFDDLLRSLADAATLEPYIVVNGSRNGLFANHLSTEGFYLLRARTKLREVANILLK